MATYSAQCSSVGGFNYASYFKLYVELWQDSNQGDIDIANNKSRVRYNVYCQSSGSGSLNANHLKYFNLNGSDIINTTVKVNVSSPNAYIGIASGVTDFISHNSDGSKSISYSAKIQASSYGVSASLSGTFTLTTIPRASSVSGGSGNIGNKATISITRASDSFTHTLRYAFGSLSETIATGVGTSYTWTIPTSFYTQIPSAPNGVGTIYCDTYSGSTLVGTKTTSFTATADKETCKPTVSATIKDTNSTTIALTGDANKLIRYKSTAQLVITSTPKNSATIKNVTVNGATVGTSNSITLNYSNVLTDNFAIIATDTREYPSSTVTVSPSYVNYVPLTLNATFFRPLPTTGEVQLTYSGNYYDGSFGAVANSLSITWKWRKKGETSWTTGGSITPTKSNNKIVQATISLGKNYDYQTSYDFQIIATDKLTTFTQTANVSVGMPVFYWGKDFLTVTGKFNANTYFSGVIHPQCWYYIGNFELGPQGTYAVLDCYLGAGQNGVAEQNTHAKILLKQGWTGDTLPIGVTTKFTQNYSSLIKVKIRHITKTNCALYIYLPFEYNDLTYVISGSYSSFGLSNTVLSDEPTTDKESTYYAPYQYYAPVSLFDNMTGTTGTIQLSESAANFSHLEIFYSDNNSCQYQSIRVPYPDGKQVTLTSMEPGLPSGDDAIFFRTSCFAISGTSITYKYASYFHFFNNNTLDVYSEKTAYNKIVKVVGYR